jgi:Ca2+-binding RTX toxin-like protein
MAVVATFDGTSDVTVTSFDPAVDQVQLALAVTAIASVAQRGTDIVITSASGAVLTIEDTALAELVQGAAGTLLLMGGGNFFVGDGTTNTVPDPLANVILGTAASDVLMGLGGNDTIDAAGPLPGVSGGSDLIYAGGGNDSVIADDNLVAAAVTRINGGAGNDTISASLTGSGTVNGGAGNDAIAIGPGSATSTILVQGGQGDDTLSLAYAGSQTVGGGQGDDIISLSVATGQAGSVLGGLGADTIGVGVAGTGTATVFGSDPSADAADGGDNIAVGAVGTVLVNGFDGNDTIGVGAGAGSVGGGKGDDSITATFATGNGNVVGGLGADTIFATGGIGAGSSLTVNGTNQSGDTVDGGDSIFASGGLGTLALNSGYGNDTIAVGGFTAGASVKAGAGDDVVTVAGSVVLGHVSTGGGNDSVSVQADAAVVAQTYTLGGGADTISIDLDATHASLYTIADYTSQDLAVLAAFPAGVATTGGALILDNGSDSVSFTGAADDLVTVDISGAGLGNFIRNGSNTATDLTGTSDADSIISTFAMDTITGGGGADTLAGGLNDNLFVETGPQLMVPGLTINGNGGADTVQVSGALALGTANITDVDAFTFSGTGDVVVAIAAGTFSTDGGMLDASGLTAGADLFLNALTSAGAVTVTGSAANDTVFGSTFGDSVGVGQGNDSVFGDAGNDTIGGGQGNDTIFGFTGADRMTGGQGNNSFDYSNLAGTALETGLTDATADAITDFKTTDLIRTGTGGAGNFAEAIVAAAVNTVAAAVNAYNTGSGIGTDQFYTFFTNGTDGYLIFDVTANGTADGAVLLTGLNDLGDFAASNIV